MTCFTRRIYLRYFCWDTLIKRISVLFFTPHGHFTKSRMKFHKIQKGSIEEAYFSEIERQGIRASDKIITISDSFHEPLLEYGAKEAQLTTVHTGIDIQDAPESKCAEKLVIACVSRLTERKGHDVLLDALARIRHHLSGVDIWIIGDGNMRGFLEEKKRKLSNVFSSENDVMCRRFWLNHLYLSCRH